MTLRLRAKTSAHRPQGAATPSKHRTGKEALAEAVRPVRPLTPFGKVMSTAMDRLEVALGGDPELPDWELRPASEAQPTWEPRPGKLTADELHALPRSLAASGSNIPDEWTKIEYVGCPPWWLRLTADVT